MKDKNERRGDIKMNTKLKLDGKENKIQIYPSFVKSVNFPLLPLINRSPLPFLIVKPIRKILRVIYANISALQYFGFLSSESIVNTPLVNLMDPVEWIFSIKPIYYSFEKSNHLVTTSIYDPWTGSLIAMDRATAFVSHSIIEGIHYYSLIFLPLSMSTNIDSFTKLQTMTSFYSDLSSYISLIKKGKLNDLSLLIIDLDNFKKVNDTLGHREGDKVLLSIVELLRSTLRKNDKLYRYGGDEFTILVPNGKVKDALKLAQRILERLDSSRGIFPKTKNIHKKIGFSIGISYYKKGLDAGQIVERGDLALYTAKNYGGMCAAVYSNISNKCYVYTFGHKPIKRRLWFSFLRKNKK